jgi:hypothetical protein
MKNLALILIAVLGASVASYAQDGTKKQEPKNKKKSEMKKAQPMSESKRIIAPVKKTN